MALPDSYLGADVPQARHTKGITSGGWRVLFLNTFWFSPY